MSGELHRITLPDGQFGVICYYYDSTKLREADAALRVQRELLEVVFEYMPAAINLIRGRDLRLLMANQAYHALAPGKTEFVGKTLDEIWPETGRDLFGAVSPRLGNRRATSRCGRPGHDPTPAGRTVGRCVFYLVALPRPPARR